MVIRGIFNVQLFEDFGKTYPLHKDKRENCGLVLMLPGSESTLYFDGKRYDTREGDCVFLPAGIDLRRISAAQSYEMLRFHQPPVPGAVRHVAKAVSDRSALPLCKGASYRRLQQHRGCGI